MVFLRSHENWDGLLETHSFIGEGAGVQVYPGPLLVGMVFLSSPSLQIGKGKLSYLVYKFQFAFS